MTDQDSKFRRCSCSSGPQQGFYCRENKAPAYPLRPIFNSCDLHVLSKVPARTAVKRKPFMNPKRIAFLIGTTAILATALSAQTFTVLHNFELTDGQNPQGMLINDSTGKLYGATRFGGDANNGSVGNGVVFQLANRNGTWQESVLHKFSDG